MDGRRWKGSLSGSRALPQPLGKFETALCHRKGCRIVSPAGWKGRMMAASQPSLFAPEPPRGLPEGLASPPDFLAEAEEEALAARLAGLPSAPSSSTASR